MRGPIHGTIGNVIIRHVPELKSNSKALEKIINNEPVQHELEPVLESSEQRLSMLPYEELGTQLDELRAQINDEYEWANVLQVFAGALNARSGHVYELKIGQEISGLCASSLHDSTASLEALYVPLKYRGLGNGLLLAESCIRSLQGQGIEKVRMTVISKGSRAIAEKLRGDYGNILEIKDEGDHILD